MNRILAVLVSLAALTLALPARADSIYTFENTSDEVYASNALTGTITISTADSSYAVTGGSFTYGGNTFSTLSSFGIVPGANYFYGDFTDAANDVYFLEIVFPPSGTTGDYALCTDLSYCSDMGSMDTSSGFAPYDAALMPPGLNFGEDVDLETGDLTPPVVVSSATPEPSSLILLGTGILGAAGVARRRFVKA
jgi:hypothetical protein